jgi:hypothetical protein
MPIIREKLRSIGQNLSLRIGVSGNNDFTGYQQEIDNLTTFTSLDLVNPVVDVEERKFKLGPIVDVSFFTFYFFKSGAYNTSFLNAGFTQSEIDNNSVKLLNSFFILDFYDTYDTNIQKKILTSYLTKLGNKPEYEVRASTNNQLYNWYIPVWYIQSQTGSTSTAYAKFTFYNAKSGTTTLFYNQDNINLITAERMYFKVQLDLVNKMWKFVGTSAPNMNAKQQINNTQYNSRINNTVTNTDSIMQNYPSGNTYQYTGNTYTTIT